MTVRQTTEEAPNRFVTDFDDVIFAQCNSCDHYHNNGETCEAFPDGIPLDIISNEIDHREPVQGDNGIRWESRPAGVHPMGYEFMRKLSSPPLPSRAAVLQMLTERIYGDRILNNAHRGDIVEIMVLAALGDEWKHVGLGWHPWDLQRGHGANRQRIQVKQTAALQLWGPTRREVLTFGWKPHPPRYFRRDNPEEPIEDEGWFCELIIFGVHDGTDPAVVDQVDPGQWQFIVVPTGDLTPRTKTMALSTARSRWTPVSWDRLREKVEEALRL